MARRHRTPIHAVAWATVSASTTANSPHSGKVIAPKQTISKAAPGRRCWTMSCAIARTRSTGGACSPQSRKGKQGALTRLSSKHNRG